MKETIVQIGDPVLRAIAKPVSKKDIGSSALTTIINKMKKALDSEEYGVAIAAPQLGFSLRIFVVAGRVFEKDSEDEPAQKPDSKKTTSTDRVYINPELARMSRKKKGMAEGCLSVRGQYGSVLRHEKASITALSEHGTPIHEHASGLLAQIFQHEVDHLNGILFVDKALNTEPWEEFKKRSKSDPAY